MPSNSNGPSAGQPTSGQPATSQGAALPPHVLRLRDLAGRKVTRFAITATADEMGAITNDLGLLGLKKMRFEGELSPLGKTDWALSATLGASVTQACVATLAPVNTRIDEAVSRRYLAKLPEITTIGGEVEMDGDDEYDPLPEVLDLMEVAIEALALALPPYPRADNAELPTTSALPKGAVPITDDPRRPFAALQALKDKMGGDTTDGDGSAD